MPIKNLDGTLLSEAGLKELEEFLLQWDVIVKLL